MGFDSLQDALADFGTFGKNIGTAFQSIPGLLLSLIDFSENSEVLSSNTEEAVDKFGDE